MQGNSKSQTGQFYITPQDLPQISGAYILLIDLPNPVSVLIKGKAATVIGKGRYLYCGSAKGPGGIAARVRRHMKKK